LNLCVESSAVLSWLFGEADAVGVREWLGRAENVLSSELTLIECDRVLIRCVTLGRLSEAEAAERRARLAQASQHWTILRLDEETAERARRPFPREPIRALDAIHLATALAARAVVPGIRLLSLDGQVRTAAEELGFEVLPG
jgi:predicted nucleic acid-binding protein